MVSVLERWADDEIELRKELPVEVRLFGCVDVRIFGFNDGPERDSSTEVVKLIPVGGSIIVGVPSLIFTRDFMGPPFENDTGVNFCLLWDVWVLIVFLNASIDFRDFFFISLASLNRVM